MGKNPDPGMKNPDHISESLETIFRLKYLGSLMRIREGQIRIRDKHPGYATLPVIAVDTNYDPGFLASRIRIQSRLLQANKF
jgi:hypothetical protein